MSTRLSTSTSTVRAPQATWILAVAEMRLMTREWAAMVFAFAFPVLLMLILAGVFGTEPSEEYGGATPDDYYVADYVAVPLGALALIGLPVMVAGYRERGVLRRFASAGVPVGVVLAAQALVTVVLVVLGATAVLAVAAPVYGVPAIQRPGMVLVGLALGTVVMLGIGLVLGMLARTTRSAQALGLLAFFPMWLLGAGGPPRAVMPEPMQVVSDVLPLGRVSAAIRESWLGTSSIGADLTALLAWLLIVGVLTVLARRRLR
ncbi:ABC transporter permease [Phytoactinopolyspora alkaliphila]|uniref:Transport permease protein n=1 Tax=Phytoactinopolyspora alkaliphila TaxID=1783498 RepID=A0A6N9YKN4_9ACTN|nr:ABC transporter permease [Phytoactinopolyspora alkaliphila]NED95429.1 ABC transporter permease [Phytoactinopolyspora alkaliphila]